MSRGDVQCMLYGTKSTYGPVEEAWKRRGVTWHRDLLANSPAFTDGLQVLLLSRALAIFHLLAFVSCVRSQSQGIATAKLPLKKEDVRGSHSRVRLQSWRHVQ